MSAADDLGLTEEAREHYALKNEAFSRTSTAIKQSQLDRDLYKTIRGIGADVAGAGFSAGGSALDLLRDSASQGALVKAVGAQQGLITEEGYRVQAKTYANMGARCWGHFLNAALTLVLILFFNGGLPKSPPTRRGVTFAADRKT